MQAQLKCLIFNALKLLLSTVVYYARRKRWTTGLQQQARAFLFFHFLHEYDSLAAMQNDQPLYVDRC